MFKLFKKKGTECSNLDDFDEDPLGWSRDLERHDNGQFSMASSQANITMEDYSQVDTGYKALFVGIYDGHGGIDAAQYLSQNLFNNILSELVETNGEMSEAVLRRAVHDTEEGFMNVVRHEYRQRHQLATVGSCCLAGLIWKGRIHTANLGDSRAVLASISRHGILRTHQLTIDHNCNNEPIRNAVRTFHHDDPEIVVENNGSYRIKGIIEVSRTIGDAWLKREDFTLNPDFPRNEVPEPFRRSVLFKHPEIFSRVLTNDDRFIIFASKGFWKHMSNFKAAQTVCRFPRMGIAKRLVITALEKAIKKTNIKSYKDLRGYSKGRTGRLAFHDDITVIVVFLDENDDRLVRRYIREMSYSGNSEIVTPSEFATAFPALTLTHIV